MTRKGKFQLRVTVITDNNKLGKICRVSGEPKLTVREEERRGKPRLKWLGDAENDLQDLKMNRLRKH